MTEPKKKKTTNKTKKINFNKLIKENAEKEKREIERCQKLAEQRKIEYEKQKKKEEREERKRIIGAVRFFIESWDRINPKDKDDELNRPMKLIEWVNSRYDINDFCGLPDELLDLKEEYVSLKEPDLREWTLYKFVECYKEFLISEIQKIIDYQTQNKCSYVKDKIKTTGLGTDEYYLQNETFNHFVDIAVEEDILRGGLVELKEDLPDNEEDTADYLRPKYIYKKKKWNF